MEDIEKRGLPRYLTAYLNYKLGNIITINEELYKEVPNDLKEYIDCIVDEKEIFDPGKFIGYPITYKEEIIEEKEEKGGGGGNYTILINPSTPVIEDDTLIVDWVSDLHLDTLLNSDNNKDITIKFVLSDSLIKEEEGDYYLDFNKVNITNAFKNNSISVDNFEISNEIKFENGNDFTYYTSGNEEFNLLIGNNYQVSFILPIVLSKISSVDLINDEYIKDNKLSLKIMYNSNLNSNYTLIVNKYIELDGGWVDGYKFFTMKNASYDSNKEKYVTYLTLEDLNNLIMPQSSVPDITFYVSGIFVNKVAGDNDPSNPENVGITIILPDLGTPEVPSVYGTEALKNSLADNSEVIFEYNNEEIGNDQGTFYSASYTDMMSPGTYTWVSM